MVIYLVAALLPKATWEVTRKRNNMPSELRQNYFVTPAYHLLIVFLLARDKKKNSIYCTFMVICQTLVKGFESISSCQH